MCGIAGWSLCPGGHLDPSALHRMADAIAHRGPDDRGSFFDAERGIALAHNRLSIIDLSAAGHQPMLSDDGRTVLTYNGELYNFRELRRELEGAGHRFRSRTDSEVVLRSYEEWGSGCVERFAGMFAFAIWSAREGRLFLARDPLGMKPLYFTELPGARGFAFASELKAFLALPGFRPRGCRPALRQFLQFGYVFDEAQTTLDGVFKLPPGHRMTVTAGLAAPPDRYFILPPAEPAAARSRAEREEELYAVLSEVVGQHLVADVPVGLLLSGGLDSSLVAALAARHAPVTTVSMGFAESAIDERPFARVVANRIGSDHREVIIHPEDVRDELESVVWYFDDLFADWGTVTTRLLYERCRASGIKVVLVGEGSDEVWGGYTWFARAHQSRGPRAWRLFDLYRHYAGRRYGALFGDFSRVMREHLAAEGGDYFGAVRRFETLNQLPNNYVMKVDKGSMSVSVEARAPFLDRRVVEVAFRTPAAELLADGRNKALLRSLADRYGLLPPEVVNREKFGGSIAFSWMEDSAEFRSYSRRVILEGDGWTDVLGLRRAMTEYFDHHRSGYRFPHALSLFQGLAWRLLLLNLWSRRYAAA